MFTLQETYETFTIAPDVGTLRRERPPVSALVVLIEDIYCNPPVQARIAQAIETLVDRHGFRLVNVEGNFDELPLRMHRHMTAQQVGEMMQQGKVTGPERVGILSSQNVAVVGVDDQELYQRNHSAMRVVMDHQSSLAPLIGALTRLTPTPMALMLGMASPGANLSAEDRRAAAALSRLLRVQAGNSDVDYVTEHRAAFSLEAIGRIVGPSTGGLDRLEVCLAAAIEFYEVARARQAAFVSGTLANMRKRNTDRSVLVVGNFHKEGVLSLLSRKEAGCLVFSPSTRGADSDDLYFQRMREQA
jgi:hypothetical protein